MFRAEQRMYKNIHMCELSITHYYYIWNHHVHPTVTISHTKRDRPLHFQGEGKNLKNSPPLNNAENSLIPYT